MRIVCHGCGTSSEFATTAGAQDVDPVCPLCGSEFVEIQEEPSADAVAPTTRPRRHRGPHAAAAVLSGVVPAGLMAGGHGPQGFTQHFTSDDGTQMSVSVTANVVPAALADTLTSTLTRMGASVSSRMATPGGGDAIVLSLPVGTGGPWAGLGDGGGPFTLGDYAVGDASFEALLDQLAGLYTPAATPAAAAAVEALPRLPVPPAPDGPDVQEADEVYAAVSPGEACPVCHDELAPGALVVQMPCSHCFHEPCLLPWLNTHNTCPVCRHALEAAGPAERRARASPAAGAGAAGSGGGGATSAAAGDGSAAAAAGGAGRAHAHRGNLAARTQHLTDMLATMRQQLAEVRTNLNAADQAAAGGQGGGGAGSGSPAGAADAATAPPPGRSVSYRWDSPARSGAGGGSGGGAGASPHPNNPALTAVGPGGVPRPLVRTNSGSQDGSRRRGLSSSSYPSSPVAPGPGALSPLRTAGDALISSRGSSPAGSLPPSSLPGGSPGWGGAGGGLSTGARRRSWDRGSGSSSLPVGGAVSTPGSPPPVTLPPAAFPPGASLLGWPTEQQQQDSQHSRSSTQPHSTSFGAGSSGVVSSTTGGPHSSSQEQLLLRHSSSDASSSSSGQEPHLLTPEELSTFAAQVDAAAGVADQLLAAAVTATPETAPALAARLQSALTAQLGASQVLLARSEEAAAAAAAAPGGGPGMSGGGGGGGGVQEDASSHGPAALSGLQSRQAASLRALSAAMRVNTAALAARTDQLEAASAAAAGHQEAVAARLSNALTQVAALRAREAALASQAEGLRVRLAALRASGEGLRTHVNGLLSTAGGEAREGSAATGDAAVPDVQDTAGQPGGAAAVVDGAAALDAAGMPGEQQQVSQQAHASDGAAGDQPTHLNDGSSTPAVTCHPLPDLAASDASSEEAAPPPAAAKQRSQRAGASSRGRPGRQRPLQRSNSASSSRQQGGSSRSAGSATSTSSALRQARTSSARLRMGVAAQRSNSNPSVQTETDGQSSSSQAAPPTGLGRWFMRWWPR